MLSLSEIQQEQKAWVKYNFGNRPSWMPLFGFVEEFGEFIDAINKKNIVEITDAIGDMVIFLVDFCSAKKWDIEQLISKENYDTKNCEKNDNNIISICKLCHHYLKSSQKIRGSKNEHDEKMKAIIKYFLSYLNYYSTSELKSDLLNIVNETWAEVKKRDWRKNDSVLRKFVRRTFGI